MKDKINELALSFRDDLMPLHSQWKVGTTLSWIRKNKRLYFLSIADRRSMKVKGEAKLRLLQSIGEAIEGIRSRRY